MSETIATHCSYSPWYEGWIGSVLYRDEALGRREHWMLLEHGTALQDIAVVFCAVLCQFADWGRGVLDDELCGWTYTLDRESAAAAAAARSGLE